MKKTRMTVERNHGENDDLLPPEGPAYYAEETYTVECGDHWVYPRLSLTVPDNATEGKLNPRLAQAWEAAEEAFFNALRAS